MSRTILAAAVLLAQTAMAHAAEQGGGLSETRRAVNAALEWVSMGIEVAGISCITRWTNVRHTGVSCAAR